MSPLGMDSYLPAVGQFAESLNVSPEAASWTLSNFLLGLGVGQLAGGALCDQKGRRYAALYGLLVFALSCFAIVAYQTLTSALAFRFLQGVGSGLMIVSGLAMIRDTTAADRLAGRLALAVFIVMIMPIVAPIIGAIILLFAPWPAVFVMSGSVAVAMFFFFFIKVPETHSDADGKLSVADAVKKYNYVLFHKTCGRHIALWQALNNAFGSAALLIFVTTAPTIIMGEFGLSSQQFPAAFGAVIVSVLIGNRLARYLLNHFAVEYLFIKGILVYFLVAIIFFIASIFIEFNLVFYLLFIMLCSGTYAAVNPAAQAIYLNLLDKNYGSATAIEQMLRFSLGGILGGVALVLPFTPVVSVASALMMGVLISTLFLSRTYSYWCNKAATP